MFKLSIKLLLSACLLLLGSFSYSQTKDQIVVTLDLDAGTMGKVPFDQRFKLGSFKTSYDKIELTYAIKDATKKPNYFKGGKATFSINKTTGIATCSDIIEPLHPNVIYQFKFTVSKAIMLSAEEEAAYRKELFKLIDDSFKDTRSLNPAKISAFKGELEKILKKYAKADKIISADGKVIDVNNTSLFTLSINPAIENVEKAYFDLNKTNGILEILDSKKNEAIAHFNSAPANTDFFKKLAAALKNDKLISDSFKKLLDSPINPSMAGNATLTLRQYLQYLIENPVARITKVIDGKEKIVGNNHEATNEVDKNSLLLLQKVFEILSRSTVTNPDKNATEYFSTTEKNFITGSFTVLENYTDKITVKEKQLALIAKQESEIPNLLKDAFITRDISIEAGAEIDVLAEKNPYIGLDAGVGYVFGSANGLFIYEGANFYLRPINRDADLSLLQGWDKFFKQFSLYIGIAQIVTEKEDSFESLFGNSSVLTGAGYRLNRAFRINVGGLLHYKKDPNPVIDDKNITFSPTVSLSVDIDLVKALGAVGEALNIN